MRVTVTGAGGFLGERLARFLLTDECPLRVTELLVTDVQKPSLEQLNDPRASAIALDLAAPGAAEQVVANTNVLFHLAAIVSGHAEANFDLGMSVNFEATRALLEAARHTSHGLRFVFASAIGVFGGDPPPAVDELTAVAPRSSYGSAKAMIELLVNEYGRRGWVDARALRLPIVSVRAGAANRAVTSFASGIVREPLNGEIAMCPVSPEQELWLSSPGTVIRNLVHGALVPGPALGAWRVLNLPALTVQVREMVEALRSIAGNEVAALVRYERDNDICQLVESFPSKCDISRAIELGFIVDSSFSDVVRQYMREIGI